MGTGNVAKLLMLAGALLFIAGAVFFLVGRFLPLGRLPGDVRVERPGGSFYFPLGTSLIVSVVLTVLLNLFLRWRGGR